MNDVLTMVATIVGSQTGIAVLLLVMAKLEP